MRIVGAWHRPSVLFSATRIARDWPPSSAIATGRRSTFSGPGSFSCRPTGCRCWRWRGRAGASRPSVWRWQQRFAEQGVDRAVARQDAQAWQSAVAGGDRGQGPGAARAASRPESDPLDGPHGRQGRRRQPARGAAHLGGAPPPAPPHPHLQEVQRPGVRRKGRGHRRPLHEPARPCRRRVDRREKPNPGARPHPARPAAEARQMRHHDPRLQAQRHDHPVRRPQRPRRHRRRPVHAEPHPPGIHQVPQRRRARRPGPARSSTPSPTTTPPTSIPRSRSGSPIIRAGSSISPPPPHPGSTPSKASSPSSPADASDAASSNPSPTSKTPSAATSASTTDPQTVRLDQTSRRHPRQAQPPACSF